MAPVMAQKFVKRGLRSPSTAKFPRGEDHTSRISDCKFRVRGAVDAQNGFGATIRSYYQIDMTHNPETGMWGGSNLSID